MWIFYVSDASSVCVRHYMTTVDFVHLYVCALRLKILKRKYLWWVIAICKYSNSVNQCDISMCAGLYINYSVIQSHLTTFFVVFLMILRPQLTIIFSINQIFFTDKPKTKNIQFIHIENTN